MRRLLLLLAAVVSLPAVAQDGPVWAGRTVAPHRLYVSPALSVSGVGGGKGPEAAVSVTYERADRFSLTARYAVGHDYDLDELFSTWETREAAGSLEAVSSASVLLGRAFSDGRHVSAHLGVGPALAWGTRHTGNRAERGGDETTSFRGLAALATAEATGRILPVLGVGGQVSVLAGPEVQVASAGLHLRVGVLW